MEKGTMEQCNLRTKKGREKICHFHLYPKNLKRNIKYFELSNRLYMYM